MLKLFRILVLIAACLILLMAGFLFISPALIRGATSGPSFPSTAANDASIGSLAWGTTANIGSSNNVNDGVGGSGASNYMKATNFGFAIPAGKTISGVEVFVEGRAGFESAATDNSVRLVKDGTITGDDKSVTTAWTGSDATHTFGGAGDVWGVALTPDDINDSTFGVVYSGNITVNGIGADLLLDAISITVHYTDSLVTSATSPGTLESDATAGTSAWASPSNAASSNDTYTTTSPGDISIPTVTTVRLVKGGVVSGDDKATDAALPPADTYVEYGGFADLWGLSLSATDINDSTFGMVLQTHQVENDGDGPPYTEFDSRYLKATNFGFSIPAGATIDGVVAEVEQKYASSAGSFTPSIDHIRMTVYYTEALGVTGSQVRVSSGAIINSGGSIIIK